MVGVVCGHKAKTIHDMKADVEYVFGVCEDELFKDVCLVLDPFGNREKTIYDATTF